MGAETKTKLAIASLSALAISAIDGHWEFVFAALLAGSWLACAVQKTLADLWLLAALAYIVCVTHSRLAATAAAVVLIAAPFTSKLQIRYQQGVTAG